MTQVRATPDDLHGELTPKQQRFVDEYLVHLNATRAYREVYGVSERVAAAAGARLLANVKVAAAITAAKLARADETKVDQQYVVTNAREVVERCMQRAPVLEYDREKRHHVQAVDEDGRDVWQFDARGAVAALSILARHTGGFSDRVDVTSRGEKIEDAHTYVAIIGGQKIPV